MIPTPTMSPERAIIAFITFDADAVYLVDVDTADMICPKAARCLTACRDLAATERGTSPLDIERWTSDNQGRPIKAEEIMGWQHLADLPMTIERAVAMVKDQATDRAVRRIAGDIMQAEEYGKDLLGKSLVAFSTVETGDRGEAVSAGDAIQAIDSEYQAREANGGSAYIETGHPDFDRHRLIEPGGVMVIAGRPSMGKSALAQFLTLQWVKHAGVPVLMFTTEVTVAKATRRFISITGRVNSEQVYSPSANSDQWRRVTGACGELAELPIYMNDTSDRAASIALQIRKAKQRHGIGIVIVDHIQECIDGVDQNQELTQLIAALRSACRTEPKTALVLVSQLNRKVESRQDKTPLMSDLRGSGSIEQAADSILLCYRPEYYASEEDKQSGSVDRGLMTVGVAKARDGKTGRMRFAWDHHNGYVLGLRARDE